MSIVIATGGFDPLHSGHIEYLRTAKSLGTQLVVGLNSDEWLTRKKGKPFMEYQERRSIIDALDCVDFICDFDDDNGTAINAISQVLQMFPDDDIIFANGGDRTAGNIPEQMHFEKYARVRFVFGVGGSNKKNSSSWILSEWKTPKTMRSWGYYRVLHTDGPSTKVKELVVDPHCQLSLQRHKDRSEHWIVTDGIATVNCGSEQKILTKHQEIDIPAGTWHQLINDTDQPLKIVEIQHGRNCIEEDIERK